MCVLYDFEMPGMSQIVCIESSRVTHNLIKWRWTLDYDETVVHDKQICARVLCSAYAYVDAQEGFKLCARKGTSAWHNNNIDLIKRTRYRNPLLLLQKDEHWILNELLDDCAIASTHVYPLIVHLSDQNPKNIVFVLCVQLNGIETCIVRRLEQFNILWKSSKCSWIIIIWSNSPNPNAFSIM